MALDDLLNNGHGLNGERSGLPGGDSHQLGDQQGDWTRPPGSGSDQELHRSQTAVALNELLRQHGLDEVGADSLLLNDSSLQQLPLAAEQPPLANLAELSPSRSLIVLDQGVANWRDLLVEAPADAEVLLLDRSCGGVEQISDFLLQERLSGARRFDTVAIVSEGADGRLLLGNGELSTSSLSSQTELLRGWSDALSAGADLLLFGCNVAASAGGAAFVRQLSALIGCDTAASDDRTGATALGGDLLLELQVGAVSARIDWLERGISERLGHVLDLSSNDQADDLQLANTSTASGLSVDQRLDQGLTQAWNSLQTRASDSDSDSASFQALLTEVYGATASDAEAFSAAAAALSADLASGDRLGLRFEIETGAEMGNAAGAYALVGDDGVPTIYINGDWLQGASDDLLQRVLLEEIGHRFDTLLNDSSDTAGDEGELFADLFTGTVLTPEQRAAISAESDVATLTIDGQQVLVEEATTATPGTFTEDSTTASGTTTSNLVGLFTSAANPNNAFTGSGTASDTMVIKVTNWVAGDNLVVNSSGNNINAVAVTALPTTAGSVNYTIPLDGTTTSFSGWLGFTNISNVSGSVAYNT
ncbi:MAG: DUF4347 domain-containing protein, partial [Vulcanococcus sp.]